MINRFINAISDFTFSNEFLKEKTGKAFSFMIICFFGFCLLSLGAYFLNVEPNVDEYLADTKVIIDQMPDFQMSSEGITFSDDSEKNVYESESIIIKSTSPVDIISTAILNPSSPDDG